MLCCACGMDSRTENACEWCNKPMQNVAPDGEGTPYPTAPPAAPLLNAPQTAPAARIPRTTLTGEVIEVPTTPIPMEQAEPGMFAAPPSSADPMMLPGGTYAGASCVTVNAEGTLYGATIPRMLRGSAGIQHKLAAERWELFLAIAASILLCSAWLVHIRPQTVHWIGFVDLFTLALALGATGAVPSCRATARFDIGLILVVTFLFGPVIALAAYLITAAVKQERSRAVVGLLVLHIFVFQGMVPVFAGSTGAMHHVGAFTRFGFLPFFALFAGFVGWLLSGFLRPIGE